MALDFPWSEFLVAQQMKNQRQQQNVNALGGGLSGIGDIIDSFRKKQATDQLLQASRGMTNAQLPVQGPAGGPPVQGPQLPGQFMSPMAPKASTPGMSNPGPVGQPIPGAMEGAQAGLEQAFGKVYTEMYGKLLNDRLDPLKQAEAAKARAMAARYNALASGQNGKPLASVWMDPKDPLTVSPVPQPGFIEYKVSQGDALGRLTGAASTKAKVGAQLGRNAVWSRSIDAKQTDEIVKRTGLTGKQQSALQQNNLRAGRALKILNAPRITYQELALGEIDLTGIMQGGVPQADEVKNTHFPGWQEQWAKVKTYANGHPQEDVPVEIQEKVRTLVMGVIDIDNKFIQSNARFSKDALLPTIRGNTNRLGRSIDTVTGDFTTQPTGGSDGWSIKLKAGQ